MRPNQISFFIAILLLALTLSTINSSQAKPEPKEIVKFSCNTTSDVISKTGVSFDKENSADKAGSLKLTADKPTTFRLFEFGNIDIDNAKLFYKAKMRSKDVDGKAYLEMWCHFPDKGQYFSRGLANPLTGTTEWTSEETPFLLKKGQKPDNIKLNVVIDGKGTVWIDDIQVIAAPNS